MRVYRRRTMSSVDIFSPGLNPILTSSTSFSCIVYKISLLQLKKKYNSNTANKWFFRYANLTRIIFYLTQI